LIFPPLEFSEIVPPAPEGAKFVVKPLVAEITPFALISPVVLTMNVPPEPAAPLLAL